MSKKLFMYFECTEGGMNTFEVDQVADLAMLRGVHEPTDKK